MNYDQLNVLMLHILLELNLYALAFDNVVNDNDKIENIINNNNNIKIINY